jgi:hypothetical protein
MKKTLLALLLAIGCAKKVEEPKIPKLEIKFIADRMWNMEQGPYTFGVLFRNYDPEMPVCVQGYVCYALVNGGICNENNLRFHSEGILNPYAQIVIPFTLQDYIYASGMRDDSERENFFNRGQSEPDTPMSVVDADFLSNEVHLELKIFELVLNDKGLYEADRILAKARHTLILDCTSCFN